MLDFRGVDYDGNLVCGSRQFVRLEVAGGDLPCVAPGMGRDPSTGDWILMLDNVGSRLPDGGVSSHELWHYGGKGRRAQLPASALPQVTADSIVKDDYVRRVLTSGLPKCMPGFVEQEPELYRVEPGKRE
ncbi:MAG: hypothetical protein ACYC99_14265 [Candidatus Geothermincolia bacterium]